ncbi:MAG TPA: hypothetical protein DCZ10_19895 [Pelotomaculum sp.]|nr:hypothetical protein [Pelotomaculum sp.]
MATAGKPSRATRTPVKVWTMCTAMENFLASGTVTGSDEWLNPGGNTLRAQMAQVLYGRPCRLVRTVCGGSTSFVKGLRTNAKM